jgi:hypothetical protein
MDERGTINQQVTRMRVLHREVKLTGPAGKIDRSADALQNLF